MKDYLNAHGLLQEIYQEDPWKVLVVCVMLNRTNHKQVRGMISEFFQRWPDPGSLANVKKEDLICVLRPLGFYNKRAQTLQKLSEGWLQGFQRVEDLPGVGKYAADSYRIFVLRDMRAKPEDKELLKYMHDKGYIGMQQPNATRDFRTDPSGHYDG